MILVKICRLYALHGPKWVCQAYREVLFFSIGVIYGLQECSILFCDDPETAIIEALNGDEHYNKVMCDFICETAKHRCDLDI